MLIRACEPCFPQKNGAQKTTNSMPLAPCSVRRAGLPNSDYHKPLENLNGREEGIFFQFVSLTNRRKHDPNGMKEAASIQH
jgi:hypothetical protein